MFTFLRLFILRNIFNIFYEVESTFSFFAGSIQRNALSSRIYADIFY